MKPKSTLRSFLAIAGSSLLAISASAATLTWDSNTGTPGVQETTGTFNWAAADAKFWNGSGNVATTNDTTTDIALFGNGTTLASSPIINVSTQSIGGLIFGATTTRGYTLQATTAQALTIGGSGITVNTGAQATTVGNANLGIILGAAQTWTNNGALLTIAGAVTNGSNLLTIGGSGGITVSGIIGNGAGGLTKNGAATLTLSGANSYTGTTTINGGTLTLSGLTGSIASSTGIALNGGNLTLTNAAGQSGVDRVGSVAITSIGGTITWTNPNGDNTANWAETLGTLSLTTGQTNIVSTNAVNAARTQVLTLGAGSLTHAASNTSAITFSGASLGTGTVNNIVISSLGDTAVNGIIGPWATHGTSVAAQTDYATYNITGGGANTLGIQGAGIAPSAQSSPWSTVHAATSNYTLANASGSALNGRLDATRNINTLRNTTASTAVTADNTSDVINLTAHGFSDGDVVVLGGTAPTGLSGGVPYYVINKTTDNFQLAATSGGPSPLLFTANGTSVTVAGGITLSTGNNLGTYGILNGSTAVLAIGRSGTGVVTLPSTTSGKLYVTPGAGNIAIHAPIADNGPGVLDLVKSGISTLTLSGNNTYTGVTTINTGNLTISHASALGTTAGNTIINATGSTATGGQLQLTGDINSAENITITGLTEIGGTPAPAIVGTANTTNTLSGNITLSNLTGGVRIATGNAGARLNFTGTISQTGSSQALVFALASAGGQTVTIDNPIALNGGSLILSGNGSPLILKGVNATNGSGIGTTTINSGGVILQLGVTDAINTTATLTNNGNFNLANFNQTVNALDGAASGIVSNSVAGTRTLTVGNGGGSGTYGGTIITGTGNIQLTKTGAGTQTLTGINTYTGATTINSGTLAVDFTAAANISGNQANHIASTSALQLGGGTLSIKGVTNGAINTAVAWTGATDSRVLTFVTLPVGMVVGQPVTGLGIPGSAYVVSIDTAGKKITINANATATSGGFTTAATTPTTSQTFVSTTLAANTASSVVVNANSGGGTVLNLSAITRNAGATMNFTLPLGTQSATNGITTSTTNTNGLLGNGLGWATVGGTDFATNSTNASGGNIVAYTYSGSTDVTRLSSGTKAIANDSTSNVRILEGTGGAADITLGAATTTINTLNQSASGAATIDPNSQTLAVNSILVGTGAGSLTIGNGTNNGTLKSAGTELLVIGNAATTINSEIADGTGASTLVKTGAATLTLTGTNTYASATAVSGGTLMLGDGTGNTGNLGGTSAISVGIGATLAVNRTGATTQFTDLNAKLITGAGSFLQAGSGTTTLGYANTYTGTTNVTAGKLIINGDQSAANGAVTVAAGTVTDTPVATLGGTGNGTTGRIGGNVSLAAESTAGFKNGGVLSPTAAANGTKLSVVGTTTFGAGSIFAWNMSATNPASDPGAATNPGSYSQLAGTGAITGTGSDAVFKIVLGAGNAFTDAFWSSNKTWDNIFTGAGATTNLASIFSSFGGTDVSTTGVVSGIGQFSFTGTSTLNWTFTAVPEPTSALAGLLLTAGLLRRRRK